MRLSIILASTAVGFSILYKYAMGKQVGAKSVFSWSFILTLLSVIGITPFAEFSDIIAYIIITIIVLNDGYDAVRGF